MRIAVVASEAVPFSKTGGLADVAGTLFKEYTGMGFDAFLFVPLYRRTAEQFGTRLQDAGIGIDVPVGKAFRKCRVFTLKMETEERQGHNSRLPRFTGAPDRVFFIGNEEYFDRDELYGTPAGDYPDNDQRFAFFCRAVMEICKVLDLRIDLMHCNDWQTGLIPLYIKTLYRDVPALEKTASVITIHNLGYQGLFPMQAMGITGLSMDLFNPEGLEFYGKVNFLKAGIVGADVITTVSGTYAKEILTPESGFGLDGILRKRAGSLMGILNGIDYAEWDPSADTYLPHTYSKSDLSGKAECKKELIKRCSLENNADAPLICFIGRLSTQKGVDLLAGAAPELIAAGADLVVIGKGDEHYQKILSSISDRFRESFFFHTGFSEDLAHLAYAGADIFLMPSRYEPCGLGQMIAMRYGTVPVARRTGGISDTVEDGLTGFLFDEYSASALAGAVRKALSAHKSRRAWQGLIKNAMGRDFSWRKSAKIYGDMYRDAVKAKGLSGAAASR